MASTNRESDRLSNTFSDVVESLFPSATPTEAISCAVLTEYTTSNYVEVLIEGIPIWGIIDTGSDIPILSGSIFQKLANLRKSS